MRYCYSCMHEIENNKANFCPACGKKIEENKTEKRYLKPGITLQQRYIVGENIGAGGFGITYIGMDLNLRRKVCIKEFYPEKYCERAEDHKTILTEEGILGERYKKGLQAFLQEARDIAALQDIKGVVRVFAYFEENNTGYIVMEYLEGMDVKSILKLSGNRSDYEWARKIVLSVLYILREIHKRGVIHRDISPDNIFVTKDGVITLIDFGAAKHAAASYGSETEVVLKPGYAPIEQYSVTAKQGPYTDLYAVAALFYRLLTGMKPLTANERLIHDTLVSPTEQGINMPEQAEMGLMMCLYLKAEYRLQSAEEFMECLDGLSFEPIYEPNWILPPPPKEKKKGFERVFDWINGKRPAEKVLICVCLALVVCGLALFGTRTFRQDNSKEENFVSAQILMPDLVGLSEEDAKNEIEQLNQDQGWNLSLVSDGTFVFNPNASKGDSIHIASVPANTDLKDKAQVEKQGLKFEDGKVSGEITYCVDTSERLHYSDLANKNIRAIAQLLGTSTDDSRFIGVEDSDKNYWDLKSIKLENGDTISSYNLNKKKNQDKELSVADIKNFNYYYAPFLYFKEFPDFVHDYGTVYKLNEKKFATYVKNSDDVNEKTGKKKKFPTTLINDDYYYISYFDDGMKGKIINQSVKPGAEFDQSNMKVSTLIDVIGTELSVEGMIGVQARDKILSMCPWLTVNDVVFVNSSGEYEVTNCDIVHEGEGKPRNENYFEKNQKVTIRLFLEEPPAPEPVPVYKPPVYIPPSEQEHTVSDVGGLL